MAEAQVAKVMEFNVPQFINADAGLQVIRMTIVIRPFVLDFAGAYLDKMPEFSEELWEEWESAKKEQFGEQWAKVREVLEALRELNIHMVDVSPNNIALPV